ncbi:MAG: hypothetical protein ACFE0I_02430 [Elainellaceae cyanobacterium]
MKNTTVTILDQLLDQYQRGMFGPYISFMDVIYPEHFDAHQWYAESQIDSQPEIYEHFLVKLLRTPWAIEDMLMKSFLEMPQKLLWSLEINQGEFRFKRFPKSIIFRNDARQRPMDLVIVPMIGDRFVCPVLHLRFKKSFLNDLASFHMWKVRKQLESAYAVPDASKMSEIEKLFYKFFPSGKYEPVFDEPEQSQNDEACRKLFFKFFGR